MRRLTEWSYTSAPPIRLYGVYKENFTFFVPGYFCLEGVIAKYISRSLFRSPPLLLSPSFIYIHLCLSPLFISHNNMQDNITTDLTEVRWNGLDRIHLAQEGDKWRAVVQKVMNIWVAYNEGCYLTSWGTLSFLRTTLLYGVSTRVIASQALALHRPTLTLSFLLKPWPYTGQRWHKSTPRWLLIL